MNTGTETKVAIVICNYNKKEYVLKCLDSVFRQTFRNFDIYVVDNASTDGSADAIRNQYKTQITLIENPENLGGSGGFNTGMRQALKGNYPYLFLLDNDVCLAETALEELHRIMEENADIGFQGCKILKMDHPDTIQEFAAGIDYNNMVVNLRHAGEMDHERLQTIEDCDSLPACALLVRTETVRKIGLMPEDNFVSWDDIEWCVRCIRAGYRVVANGNALAWHKGSVTVATNTFGVYYAYRNKIEFFMRYMQTRNDTEPVSNASAQKRADAIMTDLFRGLYACTYNRKYNRVKTMMDAFLDALSMKKGQAKSWQIRSNDLVENSFDAILAKHNKLLIDANGFLDSTKRILSHIQTYQKDTGIETDIKLISSRPLTESEILGYIVQDSSAASEEYYMPITVCEHIFKTEDTAFNGILVDGWCNVIMDADDLRYCRAYEDSYQFFKRCYEDRLVFMIMHMPAENICLSVIIPVYNMECYLDKLFDSIRPVDSDTVEWIFVDDGSADRSISMLEAFQKEHNNISVCKQNHQGACAARNLGLTQARGEYIYFFDSDDYFTADVFPKLLNVIHTDHPDLLIGNAYVVNEAYQIIGEKFTGLKDSVSTTPDELFLIDSNPGNKIFRRDIIERHGVVFDDVAIHQDLNFYLKYIPFCQNIRYISDYMYYYLVRSNSIAHHVSGKIVEVIASMEGIYQFYRKNGLAERYRKELEYNYVKHLCFQIDKLSQMKSVKEQIHVASEFIRVLKTMDYRHNPLIDQERIALVDRLLARETIYMEKDYDAIFAENQEKYDSVEKRLTLYNQVLTNWLSNKIDHHSVSDKLNNMGIHSIAIYGMGSLGMLLYRDLVQSDIQISYFIDQQAEESLFGSEQIQIIKSTEIRKQKTVDAIIITPIHVYDSIRDQLNNMNIEIPVISFLDILNNP